MNVSLAQALIVLAILIGSTFLAFYQLVSGEAVIGLYTGVLGYTIGKTANGRGPLTTRT